MAEEARIRHLFDQVEIVESVAATFEKVDERRERLMASARGVVAAVEPIRPRIAAKMLGVSERTVRTWVEEGLLHRAELPSRRLLLDPTRLHEVMHLANDLREAGRDRNLLEAIWWRLTDQALLEREDLQESLAQMRRGETVVLVDLPQDGTINLE